MEGKTPVDNGDEQEAAERSRQRRRLVVQLLLDWSPVIAEVAYHVVQRFS